MYLDFYASNVYVTPCSVNHLDIPKATLSRYLANGVIPLLHVLTYPSTGFMRKGKNQEEGRKSYAKPWAWARFPWPPHRANSKDRGACSHLSSVSMFTALSAVYVSPGETTWGPLSNLKKGLQDRSHLV